MDNIEKTIGSLTQSSQESGAAANATKKESGIDVVLGGQWGDEGKGKLVDILSQVCMCMYEFRFQMCEFVFVRAPSDSVPGSVKMDSFLYTTVVQMHYLCM